MPRVIPTALLRLTSSRVRSSRGYAVPPAPPVSEIKDEVSAMAAMPLLVPGFEFPKTASEMEAQAHKDPCCAACPLCVLVPVLLVPLHCSGPCIT